MKESIVNIPITKTTAKKKVSDVFLALSAFSFVGGILSMFTGLLFTFFHSQIVKDSLFNDLSTILMITAFPLLMLGGHFLDKSAEKRK